MSEDQELALGLEYDRMAACVLAWREDGKVLAVARPDDPSSFGFPGGGVEEGESFEEAAARELSEETGLSAASLAPVHAGLQGTTLCVVFEAQVSGTLQSSGEGEAKWLDPSELAGGAYPEFARAVFDKVGIEY